MLADEDALAVLATLPEPDVVPDCAGVAVDVGVIVAMTLPVEETVGALVPLAVVDGDNDPVALPVAVSTAVRDEVSEGEVETVALGVTTDEPEADDEPEAVVDEEGDEAGEGDAVELSKAVEAVVGVAASLGEACGLEEVDELRLGETGDAVELGVGVTLLLAAALGLAVVLGLAVPLALAVVLRLAVPLGLAGVVCPTQSTTVVADTVGMPM